MYFQTYPEDRWTKWGWNIGKWGCNRYPGWFHHFSAFRLYLMPHKTTLRKCISFKENCSEKLEFKEYFTCSHCVNHFLQDRSHPSYLFFFLSCPESRMSSFASNPLQKQRVVYEVTGDHEICRFQESNSYSRFSNVCECGYAYIVTIHYGQKKHAELVRDIWHNVFSINSRYYSDLVPYTGLYISVSIVTS